MLEKKAMFSSADEQEKERETTQQVMDLMEETKNEITTVKRGKLDKFLFLFRS